MEKKIFQEPNTYRSDVELANLNNVPHFVRNDNILYTVNGVLLDSDIASLPQINREQITMGDFLGCGAFGEVYEGTVKNVGNEHKTRVAIKTLRKGATEQEKSEFLKEAKLMSNFKHKHILSLIGVHLDIDALYIIMELMPGGDLLSYLRKKRSFEVKYFHFILLLFIICFIIMCFARLTGWPISIKTIGFNSNVC